MHFRYGMRTPQHLHYGPTDAGATGKDSAGKQASQYCCVMTLGHIVDQWVTPRLYQQRGGQKNLRPAAFLPWPILQARSVEGDGVVALDAAHLVEGRAELNQRPPAYRLSIAERMFVSKNWPEAGVVRVTPTVEGDETPSKKFTYTQMPYVARDDPSLGDYEIPEPRTYHPDHLAPFSPQSLNGRFSPRNSNVDYQSGEEMPSPAPPRHGSLKPLGDISNMQDELHGEGPTGAHCGPIGVKAATEENAAIEREIETERCEEERDENTQLCPDCRMGLGAVDSMRTLQEIAAADALDALQAPRYHGP